MTRLKGRMLVPILAAAVLAVAVGAAAANRVRITNEGIRATWTSLRMTNTANANVVLCPATLEGTLHQVTIPKTSAALMGFITRASIRENECVGGRARVKQETLPWHTRYRGYTGSLPNFTGLVIGIARLTFEITEPGGLSCVLETEGGSPFVGIIRTPAANRVATSLTPESNTNIRLRGGLCEFAEGRLSEDSQTFTVLGTTSEISIRLI